GDAAARKDKIGTLEITLPPAGRVRRDDPVRVFDPGRSRHCPSSECGRVSEMRARWFSLSPGPRRLTMERAIRGARPWHIIRAQRNPHARTPRTGSDGATG